MPVLSDELLKLHHIFDQFDLLHQVKESDLSDFCKRTLLRYYFIGIDNLLKLVGWLKNETRRNSKLDAVSIKELENEISALRASYDATYDLIRDKLTAHQQQLDLADTITWWNEIDSTTIGVFQSDISAIRLQLAKAYPSLGRSIDRLEIDWSDELLYINTSHVQMNATRLSMAIPSAVSLLPCEGSQHKGAMITAALRFIRADFYFTLKGQDWKSKQQYLLFELGWLLAVIDITSILDCLYDDTKEPSLLTLWAQDSMGGLPVLKEFNRDHVLEAEMREVRNRFAAHLDSRSSLDANRKLFEHLNLERVHKYCIALANAFLEACRSDIRSRLFLTDGMEISGVISVSRDASRPFS